MTRYSYKDFEIIFYADYAVLCFWAAVFVFRLISSARRKTG
jgi:hypothetical protein